MNERALRVLEFTKIREMLAAFALSDPGKQKCLTLTPLSDIAEVNRALDETEEAVAVLAYAAFCAVLRWRRRPPAGASGPVGGFAAVRKQKRGTGGREFPSPFPIPRSPCCGQRWISSIT